MESIYETRTLGIAREIASLASNYRLTPATSVKQVVAEVCIV